MPEPLSPEMTWLAATALITALMWVPHILWLIGSAGLAPAVMDGQHDVDYREGWPARSDRAHRNAIENLVIFASLALAVEVTGTGTTATAWAAAVFFFARATHYAVYVAGLPVVRTLLFAVGVACQITLGFTLLSAV